ncbi:choice-of-anchor E domain-containing protein [Dyadobacter sp. CY345]|nr:choice-of-anchor E domain-containing protein [Dyadobacter sp. CY345]
MNSDVTFNGTLSDFDGTRDYDGSSGDSFYDRFSYVSLDPGRKISNASQIAANFLGTENSTFEISKLAQSSVAVTGCRNFETVVQTYVSLEALF